jgi:hypothetical protein
VSRWPMITNLVQGHCAVRLMLDTLASLDA